MASHEKAGSIAMSIQTKETNLLNKQSIKCSLSKDKSNTILAVNAHATNIINPKMHAISESEILKSFTCPNSA